MRRLVSALALTPLAAVASLGACRSETAGPVAAKLVAAPSALEFSDTQTERSLFLTTEPSGGRLEWQIASKPEWIALAPPSGVVHGSVVTVKVTAAGLATAEPGHLSGRLELVSNGGTATVALIAEVQPNPIPSPSVSTVTIPGNSDAASFVITNTGRGTLTWQLAPSIPSITVSPTSGYLGTGAAATISVKVDKEPLAVGTVEAALTIKSNAKGGDVSLPVSIVVSPTPRIGVSAGRLAFPQGVTTRTFYVTNRGKGPLTWSVGNKDAWLSLSPAGGTVAAPDSVLVTATVARENVPGGTATGSLVLASDAVNGSATVAVEVASTPALSLGVHVLDHRVVDAEFSAPGGLLVTVSAGPNRLNIIDVETGAIGSVNLPQVPTCVAIRSDGAFAAVGHDGYVTVVDLTTKAVTRTYPVTTDALDIVLPQNGYVYVFPRRDQWESIRAVNLATGVETQSAGWSIYAGTLGRLHPSGDFIYGANNGLSPSDFEKYDIRKGTPTVMYDSPYHGDYAFGGNVWISEDGTRLFARSGNVFRSSPVQAEDMRYAGKLAGINAVRWAADSRARSRVYVLGAADAPFGDDRTPDINVFESAFLAAQGAVALPRMSAAGTPVDVDGQFLFVGSGAARLYVLLKAVASAGLQQDWALAVLDPATLP
jgi:hypothetical protein